MTAWIALGITVPCASAPARGFDVSQPRSDLILIAKTPDGTKPEYPPVAFFHDRHTLALKERADSCGICHAAAGAEKTFSSFAYKDTAVSGAKSPGDLYHASCTGCHTEMGRNGRKTGPPQAACRNCHSDALAAPPQRPVRLDKALHYLHIASPKIPASLDGRNCGSCHHVEEDSCYTCHPAAGAIPVNKIKGDAPPPLRQASHQSCIHCHLSVKSAGGKSAETIPVTCSACHGPEAQKASAARTAYPDVPRLQRGQPDARLLLPMAKKNIKFTGMQAPISFNHKLHENVNTDCRGCHHKKIGDCTSCHPLEGNDSGDHISLHTAMHSKKAKQSCVGCHEAQMRKKIYAAGYANMRRGNALYAACAFCHAASEGGGRERAKYRGIYDLSPEEKTKTAGEEAAKRAANAAAPSARKAVPERLEISLLSEKYHPVGLPHARIIAALQKSFRSNRLASAFHVRADALCRTCHHNSGREAWKPLKCVSCHMVAKHIPKGFIVNLENAYHRQCITCHEALQQKPLGEDCEGCHKKIAEKQGGSRD
jgi:hypothetical protein